MIYHTQNGLAVLADRSEMSGCGRSQPRDALLLTDQEQQRRHFGAAVAAGEGLAQGEEERLARAATTFLAGRGQCLPGRLGPIDRGGDIRRRRPETTRGGEGTRVS